MLESYIFFFCAFVAVASALAMVFSKNAVHSALFLLLNLVMLAVVYILLNAQFIAAIQIVVYAGAIVVLVLFVIMLLGAELGEKIPNWITVKNVLIAFGATVLFTLTGTAVFEWLNPANAIKGDVTDELVAQVGSVELVGAELFSKYLLAFELTSILLLVGIVGVVTLGGWRKVQHRERGQQ